MTQHIKKHRPRTTLLPPGAHREIFTLIKSPGEKISVLCECPIGHDHPFEHDDRIGPIEAAQDETEMVEAG